MMVGQDIAVGSVYDNTGTNTMTKDFIRGVEKTFEWTTKTIRLITLLINRWMRYEAYGAQRDDGRINLFSNVDESLP